jgi:hypothetical protein
MPKTLSKLLAFTLFASALSLSARPISAPLVIFESTKLPHRTLKDGPSIFGTLPFFNEKNATEKEKKEYKKMVEEIKKREKKNEKYRRSKAMQVFESTKIHRDPSQGPSAVRKAFSEVFSAVGLEEDKPSPKK